MAHGDTYKSALANTKEAVRLWIAIAKEFGDPILEPKGCRLTYPSIGYLKENRKNREAQQNLFDSVFRRENFDGGIHNKISHGNAKTQR